jgi:hypothetical protein
VLQVLEKSPSDIHNYMSFGICQQRRRVDFSWSGQDLGEWDHSYGFIQSCDPENCDSYFGANSNLDEIETDVPHIVAGDVLGLKFSRADPQRGNVTMVFTVNGEEVHSYSKLPWRPNFVLAVSLPQSTTVKILTGISSSMASDIDSLIDGFVLYGCFEGGMEHFPRFVLML